MSLYLFTVIDSREGNIPLVEYYILLGSGPMGFVSIIKYAFSFQVAEKEFKVLKSYAMLNTILMKEVAKNSTT